MKLGVRVMTALWKEEISSLPTFCKVDGINLELGTGPALMHEITEQLLP
jgi:hypothetical protein